MKRAIKQLTLSENGTVVALCEDGTMWCISLTYRERGWWQLPSIPESE